MGITVHKPEDGQNFTGSFNFNNIDQALDEYNRGLKVEERLTPPSHSASLYQPETCNEPVEKPSIQMTVENNHQELVREGIDNRLKRGEYRAVKLETKDDFLYPAYVVDISECGPVMPSLLATFSWLTSDKQNEGAELTTNMYLKTSEGIFSIGIADSVLLRNVLDSFVATAFGDKAKLLYSSGRGFRTYKNSNADGLRMDL